MWKEAEVDPSLLKYWLENTFKLKCFLLRAASNSRTAQQCLGLQPLAQTRPSLCSWHHDGYSDHSKLAEEEKADRWVSRSPGTVCLTQLWRKTRKLKRQPGRTLGSLEHSCYLTKSPPELQGAGTATGVAHFSWAGARGFYRLCLGSCRNQ